MSIKMNLVTKRYKDVTALSKMGVEFCDNTITGLIGFNGSGKTTSFNILTNLIEDFDGSVTIVENGRERPVQQRDRIQFSYLAAGAEPQNQEKVMHHLRYIGALHGLSKIKIQQQIAEPVKVLGFEGQLTKKIKSLSKGNQQKIKLISAFINPHTKYLFLDEPFDGLDPVMVERVKRLIIELKHRRGLSIVISSHRMEVIDQMCDAYYILRKGVIVERKDQTALQTDQTITIAVNKEVSLPSIRHFKNVLTVSKNEKEIIIKAKNIQAFKTINQQLILDPNYVWSSYRKIKLTESVFEKYANEEKPSN